MEMGIGPIGYLLLTIHRRVLQRSQDPLVGLVGVEFGQLIQRKIIQNVATTCQI